LLRPDPRAPGLVLGDDVQIGDDVRIGAHVVLHAGVRVGAGCVIEDHAVRHSWHHLAKIRKLLGR